MVYRGKIVPIHHNQFSFSSCVLSYVITCLREDDYLRNLARMKTCDFLPGKINGLRRILDVCGAKELTPLPGRSAAEEATASQSLLFPVTNFLWDQVC